MENLQTYSDYCEAEKARGQAGMLVLLNIEIPDVQCVIFDEFAPGFYCVAH
jgi:hypothetical protein